MKLSTRFLIALALIFAFSVAYSQQAEIDIAGGGGVATSTYSQMLNDYIKVCGTDDQPLKETNTSGGPANLQMLRTNKIPLAVIPSDLLAAAQLQNPSSVANIRILFTLHPEAVHVIARADTKTEGGHELLGAKWGGTDVTYDSIDKLRGRQVGAVGGSAMTGRILGDLLKTGWNIKDYPSTEGLLAALSKHEVDAIIVVAGAPSPAVEKIGGGFRLLPLHGNKATDGVYKNATVQYLNLNGNQPVDTVSEQAVMATRVWASDEMVAKMATLRQCFVKKLPGIKDAQGTHASWQDVDASDQGLKGFWYALPLPAKDVAVTPTKKAKK